MTSWAFSKDLFGEDGVDELAAVVDEQGGDDPEAEVLVEGVGAAEVEVIGEIAGGGLFAGMASAADSNCLLP